MAVVYYNPLTFLYWYDKPSKYAQGEWPELGFFDECPTTWDETRVLAGEIGEYIVIARRHGQRWFLGAMTNESPRQLDVPLSFLAPGNWEAHLYADGPAARVANQTPVRVSRQSVSSSTRVRLDLVPSGGQAIRFEPR
jgi:alpha-glucosidase